MNRPIDPLLHPARPRRSAADRVTIEAIFREHRSRLVGLAAAITLDRNLAEEIVQDAFVGLQRHGAQVDNPLGYLQRSVTNLGINAQRRRRTVQAHVVPPPVPATTPEIDEAWAVVVNLPTRQRAVVVLRFWQDMTIEAIAETLHWPLGSVKSTLHRALKTLRKELR